MINLTYKKLLTDTVNKMMKSDFSVCGSLIDDVVDRINDIVSSMDVSDEPKSCPFVLESTQ
ncbi:unnamed protein product, partial [Brassica oleracea var. botrytis]